jgi:hypothetical protein
MTTRLPVGRLGLALVLTSLLASACTEPRQRKPPQIPTKLQTAIAIDKDGNRILVGTFAGYMDVAGTRLESAGGTDIFVAKIKPDGTAAWPPRRYGGPMDDAGTGAAVDGDGNIIIAGSFQGELSLGAQRLAPKFRSPELHALFVAKLDPFGKELWLRQVGVVDRPSTVSAAVAPGGKITVGAGVFGRLQKDGKAVNGLGESLLLQELGPTGDSLPTPGVLLVPLDNPQCTHSPCQAGAKLVSNCDWCVATVCNADPYCCNTWWDSICVGEVRSDCGQRCDCSGNNLCMAGNPFNLYACACTSTVCSADPYCCNIQWDSICVGEAHGFCGVCP